MKKFFGAFTLIELLVVIVILGLLASIIFPVVMKFYQKKDPVNSLLEKVEYKKINK